MLLRYSGESSHSSDFLHILWSESPCLHPSLSFSLPPASWDHFPLDKVRHILVSGPACREHPQDKCLPCEVAVSTKRENSCKVLRRKKKKTASEWSRKRGAPDTWDLVWGSGLFSVFLETLLILTARPGAPLLDNMISENTTIRHWRADAVKKWEKNTIPVQTTEHPMPRSLPQIVVTTRHNGIFVIYFIFFFLKDIIPY